VIFFKAPMKLTIAVDVWEASDFTKLGAGVSVADFREDITRAAQIYAQALQIRALHEILTENQEEQRAKMQVFPPLLIETLETVESALRQAWQEITEFHRIEDRKRRREKTA